MYVCMQTTLGYATQAVVYTVHLSLSCVLYSQSIIEAW